MDTLTKDPDAVLDYRWDWSAWLTDGEQIEQAQVIVPDGLVKDSDSHAASTVTVWLSGGEAGTDHEVTNRITTSAGRVDDRTFLIRVRHK